jgi:alkylated DNA repair dioxygenase AlkB
VVAHQRSLFAAGEPAVARDAIVERRALDESSWVDIGRGWLEGADTLLDEVVTVVPWTQGRRRMYDRMVDDPRLSWRAARDDPLPHPALERVRDALRARYDVPFGGVGLNYYRDGRDSVAPHRDRELRDLDVDSLVAILTLGARRPFLLKPHGRRGRAVDVAPASGDLLVMGGRCQLHWEHGIPKVAHAGPRVSCTWRWKPDA